ncbi:hypothetical protein [Rufibacter tibetensis]|uniref:N-acetyltransferase domain-containing protein n=1 Tax=Rufibacter tibetensis TaxID=512763 RepID=A0A0N7HX09_9BACT|nr:hypothetical protein [Rufibacter tibetensis]ALJ00737.1 hypothetical protein DC20_19325 [Rufibacter tibetensis]
MNKFLLLLLILVSSISFAALAQKRIDKAVEIYQEKFFLSLIITQDSNKVGGYPVGNYYDFVGITRNGVTQIGGTNHPELIIGFLVGQGMNIEESWYREPLTRCDYAEVMVPSSLAIRVKSNAQEGLLKKLGFRKVEKPRDGCPNGSVVHYDFRISGKK